MKKQKFNLLLFFLIPLLWSMSNDKIDGKNKITKDKDKVFIESNSLDSLICSEINSYRKSSGVNSVKCSDYGNAFCKEMSKEFNLKIESKKIDAERNIILSDDKIIIIESGTIYIPQLNYNSYERFSKLIVFKWLQCDEYKKSILKNNIKSISIGHYFVKDEKSPENQYNFISTIILNM